MNIVALPESWVVIVSLLIPVLTAIVSRYRGSTKVVQALVALVASGVLAAVGMLTDDVPNDTVGSIVTAFLVVFIPAVMSYLGFWKPVVDINQRMAPTKGI